MTNKYSMKQLLGYGANGFVVSAVDKKSMTKVAIKMLPKNLYSTMDTVVKQ